MLATRRLGPWRLVLVVAVMAARCAASPNSISLAPSASKSIVAASSSIEAIASSTPASFPLPMPCTGEACTEFTTACQDLNVIQHLNGTFFRVSKDNGTNTGLQLASAPDISGPWVLQKPIFGPDNALVDLPASQRADTALWTPEIHIVNGTYYLFYAIFNTDNNGNSFSIRVATSPTMADDSWTDYGNISIPDTAATASIDANVMADYETDPYGIAPPLSIVWGSFGAGLYGMQLDPTNLTRIAPGTSPSFLVQDQLYPVSPANNHAGNNRTGGAFHMQMNGWVYFFYDIGSCCSNQVASAYSVYVCRATNSTGPYYDKNGLNCAGKPDGSLNGAGTTILQSHSPDANGDYQVLAPGAVGIVSTPQGPIMTYQYANQSHKNPIAESLFFGFNYLNFDDQGWPFLSTTPQALSSTNNTGPNSTGPNNTGSTNTASTLTVAYWLPLIVCLSIPLSIFFTL